MNAEILLEFSQKIVRLDKETSAHNSLQRLTNGLQKLSQNPQDQNSQNELAVSLDEAELKLKDLNEVFFPRKI